MRRAFLETAHIRGSYGGKPVDWTLSEFCELIDKHGPAAEIAAQLAGRVGRLRDALEGFGSGAG